MEMANQSSSETDIAAEWLFRLRLEDVPDATLHAAKACILDSLGCIIAGLRSKPCEIMLNVFSQQTETGKVTIPGTGRRLPMMDAAYLMAHAANILDFDDSFRDGAAGHPGATIVPPALAMGEWGNHSGADFLRAVIAGYEISLRVGRAIQPSPDRGRQVFGYATWQIFGAMGVGAVLQKLNQGQIANAFGIAALHATVPGGRKGGMGETAPFPWLKNVYGAASRGGLWAALLAQNEYVGHRHVFEGPTGFWIMASSDSYRPALLTAELGKTWFIERVGFKPYACCRWTHTMIDAIRSCLPIMAGREIRDVEVAGFGELMTLDADFPKSVIDAQFNARYLAALELAGKSSEQGLREADLDDIELRQLVDKIRLRHDPEADIGFFNEGSLPVRVSIRLADGDSFVVPVQFPRGSARACGYTQRDIEAKFLQLTSAYLGRRRSENLVAAVQSIEKQDMREIVRMIQ